MKYLISLPSRVFLLIPLIILAYLFSGLEELFKRLSDGLFDAATAMRQITMLPYVKDLKKAQEDASAKDLQILLRGLE